MPPNIIIPRTSYILLLSIYLEFYFYNCAGHFPWLFSLVKLAFAHSEAGKGVAYILKVAMDLVKARRENGHSDKVCRWKICISLPACMYQVCLHI